MDLFQNCIPNLGVEDSLGLKEEKENEHLPNHNFDWFEEFDDYMSGKNQEWLDDI